MPNRLTEELRAFAREILDPFDPDELLQRVLERAMTVFEAEGAGIMLVTATGSLDFAAASGEEVAALERLQDEERTGTCHEAFETNQIVAVGDPGEMKDWTKYAARAEELGLLSVLGVPLNAWGQTIGVLNVYREYPSEWTPEDLEAGEILAAMAAGYIISASQSRSQEQLTDQLREALQSRGIIERAKGILMEREDLETEEAFAALRQRSMDSNEKLRDVARLIVDDVDNR